jgi:hypothetical protein
MLSVLTFTVEPTTGRWMDRPPGRGGGREAKSYCTIEVAVRRRRRRASPRGAASFVLPSPSYLLVLLVLLVVAPSSMNVDRDGTGGDDDGTIISPFAALAAAASGSLAVPLRGEDCYCGASWADAATRCISPPGGGVDCAALDPDYECSYFTGCGGGGGDDDDADAEGSIYGDGDGSGGDGGGVDGNTAAVVDVDVDASENNFCGASWTGATMDCSAPCPTGMHSECTNPGERCYMATNCLWPLERLRGELRATLYGPDEAMEGEDMDVFASTMYDHMKGATDVRGIALSGVDIGDQSVVTMTGASERRAVRSRGPAFGGDRHLDFDATNVTTRRRGLPAGSSSAIDVAVIVTGDYRPPPYLDLDSIVEESINRDDNAAFVDVLRERGELAGRDYFDRVVAVEAVRIADLAPRPTGSPIGAPIASPMPSSDPTREYQRCLWGDIEIFLNSRYHLPVHVHLDLSFP